MMKHTLFSFYLKLCTRQGASFIACVSWDVNGPVIETIPVPEMHVWSCAHLDLGQLCSKRQCAAGAGREGVTADFGVIRLCLVELNLFVSHQSSHFWSQNLHVNIWQGGQLERQTKCVWKTVKNTEIHTLISFSWAHRFTHILHIHTRTYTRTHTSQGYTHMQNLLFL